MFVLSEDTPTGMINDRYAMNATHSAVISSDLSSSESSPSAPIPVWVPPRNLTTSNERAALLYAAYTRRIHNLHLSFKPTLPASHVVSPSNVYVCTFPKSGTTLTQALLYTLIARAGLVPADPSASAYEDISAVAPFLDVAEATGVHKPLHAGALSLFKTHILPERLPESGKASVIILVRHGLRAAASFLDFTLPLCPELDVHSADEATRTAFFATHLRNMVLSRGASDPENSDDSDGFPRASHWTRHVLQALSRAERDERTLLLLYEDVVADPPTAVRRLARHVGISASETLVKQTVAQCAREKMVDDHRFRDSIIANMFARMGRKDDNDVGMGESGVRVRVANAAGFASMDVPEEVRSEFERELVRYFAVPSYEMLSKHVQKLDVTQ